MNSSRRPREGSLLEARINALELATGIDLDQDNDVGLPGSPNLPTASTPTRNLPMALPIAIPVTPIDMEGIPSGALPTALPIAVPTASAGVDSLPVALPVPMIGAAAEGLPVAVLTEAQAVPSPASLGLAPPPQLPDTASLSEESFEHAMAEGIRQSLEAAEGPRRAARARWNRIKRVVAMVARERRIDECPLCCAENEPSWRPSGCEHELCVGCATRYVREALQDAGAHVQPAGLRCPFSGAGCGIFVTAEDTTRLLPLGGGGGDGGGGEDGSPLSPAECKRLHRLMIEAAIPIDNRAYCPSCELPAFKDAIVFRQRGPRPDPSVQCGYCGHCFDPDARADDDAATAATEAYVAATSKGCPNPACGQRVTHYHGHACHHISPSTNGCPSVWLTASRRWNG